MLPTRVESLHAAAQAEQQSELEDLARKYEAEGKPEIAVTLRKRASGLTSSNLAAEALTVFQAVAGEPLHLTGPVAAPPEELRSLPEFDQAPARSRNKRKTSPVVDPSSETLGDLS